MLIRIFVRTDFRIIAKSFLTIFTYLIIGFITLLNNVLFGQSFHIIGTWALTSLNLNSGECGNCSIQTIGLPGPDESGISFGPDNNLYYLNTIYPGPQSQIYQVDIATGNWGSPIFTGPVLDHMYGFVSVGGGIFYSKTSFISSTDILYRWDINAGTVIAVGNIPYNGNSDMTMAWGEIYYEAKSVPTGFNGIVRLDTINPGNSELLFTYPWNISFTGLTASPFCNTLLGLDGYDPGVLKLINLIDGTISPYCSFDQQDPTYISSPLEFAPPTPCLATLDLDCNDSSGATNADYNSPDYDCLSNGVGVADEDIKMLYDAIISEMKIQITGFVPDAPFELLFMTGSVAGINVSGSGTDMITLSNAGGAKSTDFKDALRLIVYNNISNYPTGGLRTVVVQFTTESGAMSNIATAFIQVNELQRVPVDLGPDQQQCDGETTIFDAGNPGASYSWSTGQHSQKITTGMSGQYIVTVSNGIL
ncbi:MAG: hypothetical protein ABI763_17455, partial [Bacteroidota bacterium]